MSIRSIAQMIAQRLDRVAVPVDEEGEALFSETNPGYFESETLNEVAEEVEEIEQHIHNDELWWGATAAPNQDNAIDANVNRPYVLVSGNNTWGAAVSIIGRLDNPAKPWQTLFDMHRIEVVAVDNATPWRIRFLCGNESLLEALNAERWTETMFEATGVGANLIASPIEIRARPIPVGWKVWAQCWNVTNADEIDIFVGVHGYPVRSM